MARTEKKKASEAQESKLTLTRLMRDMNKGDRLILPLDRIRYAKSLASNLKRDYGVKYKVRRFREGWTKYDYVIVTRVL